VASPVFFHFRKKSILEKKRIKKKVKRFQSDEHVAPKKIKMFFELYKYHSLQEVCPVV
jgi:hypothetical protein